MTWDQAAVSLLGLALILGIVWFFWIKQSVGLRAASTGALQEVSVLVKGGYTPDTVIVKKGVLVRFNFRREETSSCSNTVMFPDFDTSAQLPEGETVRLEFVPDKSGEYEFTCQMGMLRGKLIVEDV